MFVKFLEIIFLVSTVLMIIPYFYLKYKDAKFDMNELDERQEELRLENINLAYQVFNAMTGIFFLLSVCGVDLDVEWLLLLYFFLPSEVEQLSNVFRGVYFAVDSVGKNYDKWFVLYTVGGLGILISSGLLIYNGKYIFGINNFPYILILSIMGVVISLSYFFRKKMDVIVEQEED